jgi:hypothetical protein
MEVLFFCSTQANSQAYMNGRKLKRGGHVCNQKLKQATSHRSAGRTALPHPLGQSLSHCQDKAVSQRRQITD